MKLSERLRRGNRHSPNCSVYGANGELGIICTCPLAKDIEQARAMEQALEVVRLQPSEIPGNWTAEIADLVSSGNSPAQALKRTVMLIKFRHEVEHEFISLSSEATLEFLRAEGYTDDEIKAAFSYVTIASAAEKISAALAGPTGGTE